jgi:hypothetical protein
MPQTTILAAGQTAATSTNVVVAAGDVVSVGLFTAAGAVPSGVEIDIRMATPGEDNFVAKLTQANQTTAISGPGTFRAYRKNIAAQGVNVGVYVES